jgi:DNA repair protein RadC
MANAWGRRRVECLRLKCEALFDELFQLIKSGTNLELASVKVLGEYEIVKATAAITLSTRLFKRNEERTTREWEEIRKTLGI